MWTKIFNFFRVMTTYVLPLFVIVVILALAVRDSKKKDNTQNQEKYIKRDDVIKLIRNNIETAHERQSIGLDISYLIDEVEKLDTIERY